MDTELVIGMVAPAKTPAPIVTLLQKEVATILTQPDVKATLAKFSFQPVGSTPEEFASQIKSDIVTWKKVMKDANIPVN